ncbi:hypothetical protein [Brevundimonas sp.]|uniref:DUF6968 family protein n=1 Tax=Brevundimonas sp. TaxID=1871086 RepID=UPI00356356F0
MKSSVVCERTYHTHRDGEVHPVPVRWRIPVPDPRGGWSCEYEIEWPQREVRIARAYGVDSVQALYLALQNVAAELYTARPAVFLFEPDDILHLPTAGLDDFEAARTKGRP